MRNTADDRDVCEELQAFQRTLWNEWDDSPPVELYHYTTPSGLRGILTHRSLWLSDSISLLSNDSREGRYWLEIVNSVLARKSVPRYLQDYFLNHEEALAPGLVWFLYVGCMSGERRLRNQWDSYADERRGYAIGCRYDELLKNADGGQRYAIFRVLYDRTEQVRMVEATIDKAIELRRGLGLRGKEERAFWSEVRFRLFVLGRRLKAPEYEPEQEWRIFINEGDRSNAKERIGPHGPIWYLDLPLGSRTVTRVIRGSRCAESPEMVLTLLSEMGFRNTEVETATDEELV